MRDVARQPRASPLSQCCDSFHPRLATTRRGCFVLTKRRRLDTGTPDPASYFANRLGEWRDLRAPLPCERPLALAVSTAVGALALSA